MDTDAVPDGWSVWDHVEDDRLILAYRPDIFDGTQFDPACLPTLYVREGERDLRRTGLAPATGTEGMWTVTLFLEPEVSERLGACQSFKAACELAFDHARAFTRGEIDIEAIYHDPREAYLDTLDSMLG